jgi:hypothetical protein
MITAQKGKIGLRFVTVQAFAIPCRRLYLAAPHVKSPGKHLTTKFEKGIISTGEVLTNPTTFWRT